MVDCEWVFCTLNILGCFPFLGAVKYHFFSVFSVTCWPFTNDGACVFDGSMIFAICQVGIC